tara:strand:- start:2010 stop:2486 length:477 start_codon:yes stop_codon:yes gene_type:complete
MSWEKVIKNATREGEQYYKEYLASMYDWFETCMGIIREELDRLETVLADINSRAADAERLGFINIIEEARRKGAVVRQLIYKALDDVKDTEKVVRDLEEVSKGRPIHIVLRILSEHMSESFELTSNDMFPASPALDQKKVDDILHRLDFEGSGRRDFT